MTESEIKELVAKQRDYFCSGKTLPLKFRKIQLKKLYSWIKENQEEIHSALKTDLGKSGFEAFMCETGLVLSEISYMLKKLKKFASCYRVKTPLAQFHSKSYKKPSPKGTVLIMSPWNYPFMLSIEPLVDCLAAGNTAIVKPSAYSPATGEVVEKLISECFPPEYVSTVKGGRAENTSLLKEKFDHIFFTGSQAVGKEVMKAAGENLTPVTLELGGKSPCLVLKDANLSLAARRIVFGKFLNCGQTCVTPDFIYCQEEIKAALLEKIKEEIIRQFGKEPLNNPDYGKIINQKHFIRLLGLIDRENIFTGGRAKEETLQIEPTVLDNQDFDSPAMKEEIFGPILPVLTFKEEEDALKKLIKLPHPLAFYIFTGKRNKAEKFLSRVGFGGGCINDTVIHIATSEMGFGGFGESGMGSYHGEEGFLTFSHLKSIVDKKTWIDLPMRYQPYKKLNEKIVRFFLK